MDRPNLFLEDTDFNICLSWLCDSTYGQTYSIIDRFSNKMKRPEGMSEQEWTEKICDVFNCQKWENIIGWKHDYRVDDPTATEEANRMVKSLNAFIDRLNRDPDYRHWDYSGVWLLKCKKDGQDYFTFKYCGEKSNACKFSADLVISELGDGDGENGGKGSLKNCIGEIADCFMTSGTYNYANCVFSFSEVTEEV